MRHSLLPFLLLLAGSLAAQSPSPSTSPKATGPLKISDRGIGLVIRDGDYDRLLKIRQRGSQWSLDTLYQQGALANRFDGSAGFAAWLVGPPTKDYSDESGRPLYLYKTRIIRPDGTVTNEGPAYFYQPGFLTCWLPVSGGPAGLWQVEFLIVRRSDGVTVQTEVLDFELLP